eukprot:715387_1
MADYLKNRYLVLQIVMILSGILSFLLYVPHYLLHIDDINALFPLLTCFIIIYNFPNQVHSPLADTLCLLKLGENSDQYGRQRLGATVGWGVIHIALGFALDFGMKIQFIVVLFVIFSIPSIITLHIAFHGMNTVNKTKALVEMELMDIHTQDADEYNKTFITNKSDDAAETECMVKGSDNMDQDDAPISMCDTLKFITKSKANIGINIVNFMWGGMLSIIDSLLFVYIEQLEGDSNDLTYTYLGLAVAATLPFEVLMLYVSKWFVWNIGYSKMIHLHGFIFAFVKVSTVQLMSEMFPPKYAASAQGLSHALQKGVGPFLFVVLGGFALDYIGGKWMYRICAMAAFATMVVFHYLSHGNDMFKAKKLIC